MTRHVDFGNDRDVALSRVRDDPTHIILRIKAPIEARTTRSRIDVSSGSRPRGDAPCSDFREAGVLLDLQAPSLVVREMPMQHIQLVERHPVDELHDELRRLKVTGRVEHQAAPGQPWTVADTLGRNRDSAGSGTSGCAQLPHSNGSIEQSARIAGGQHDPPRRHIDRIAFRIGAGLCLVEPERDRALG